MAWMDFIKRIRQDEEEEKNNPQGGMWSFLDDVLDVASRSGQAVRRQVSRPEEGGDSDYDALDFLRDIPENVSGVVAGAGREFSKGLGATLNRAQNDPRLENIDELLKMPEEERNRIVEDKNDPRSATLQVAKKQLGDLSDETLNKRRGTVTEEQSKHGVITPETRTEKLIWGNEPVHPIQDQPRVGTEAAKRQGIDGPAANVIGGLYGLGMAALESPFNKPAKAVKEIGEEGIEFLAKNTDPKVVRNFISKNANVAKDKIEDIVETVAKSDSADDISELVNGRVRQLRDVAKAADTTADNTADASIVISRAPTESKELAEQVSRGKLAAKTDTVPIESLKFGSDTAGDIDTRQVNKYVSDLKAGKTIDPLVVSDDAGEMFVQDGKHRLAAMRQMGVTEVPIVRQIPDGGIQTSTADLVTDYNKRALGNVAPAAAPDVAREAVEATPEREISEFATSVAQDYRRADDFANDVADSMYDMDKTLRGGQMIPDGEGGYRRMSEHTPFYRDFYARNKRAPSRTDYQTAVREQMERGNGDLVEQDMVDAYGLIKNREGEVASLDQAPAQQFMDIVKQPAETPRDLQGGPGRQKIRSFLQTAKEGPYTTPEAKAAIDEIQPEKYTVQSQDPVLNAARQRVEKDFDGAMRYVDDNDKWTDDKAATLMELASKAMNEGRTDDFVDLLKRIDEGGREAGRGIAILNAWKRLSPEGIVKMAQREVDDIGSQGRLKPTVERLKKEVENATKLKPKDVQRAIDDALKQTDEVGDEAAEKSVGEKVAKNIESYMSPQKKKKVDELVTELTKKIKQEMLPARDGAPKRTATDVLKDVYKRGDEAAEAWPEAKEILRERFADNPEVLEQLDTFFRTSLGSPAASRTLDAAIRETMQKNKVRIAEVIQKSWDEQITDITGIARRLTESGFSPEDSRIIAEEVGSRVKSQVDAAKLKQLQRFAKEAPKKVRPALEDKIAKFSNLGAMNDSDYYDLVRVKLDLPTLDNKAIEKISGLAQKMQALPDGPERSVVLGDILKSIADTMPVTGREKFNAYRYQNLLSSPRTQLRNIAANTFNTLITRPATLFTGAAGDTIASAIGKKPRERFFKEIPAYYSGLARGYLEANKAMEAAWKGTADITNPDFADQFGKGAIQQARMRNLPKKWTVVSRLMEAQDKMFSGMIGGGEYNALIKRGVPEEEAVKRAHEMAEYSLLRQALDPKNATGQGAMLSAIDAASAAITDFANKVPMGRWMVPFVRTPLNFGKQWLEFSPVGLVNATAGDTLARRAGREVMTDERRIEALNKGMLGTALTGLGVTLAAEDKLTWSVPDNQRDRDLFYAQGKKPYSVKIGDKWIPMINFGPFGFALGLPASFKHNFAESPDSMNDNVAQKLYKSVASMGELLSQQTFLQGVNNLFSLISGDEDMNFEKFAAGLGGQVIPLNSLIRYAASITDPVYREAESFVDYIKRDIPGLSNDLPAQTNVATGEPTVRNWSDYVAPYSIGTENSNPDKQGNVDAVAEFYQSLARGNNQRTKTNEKITEALLAKDNQEANRLALEHNGRVLSETKRFIDSHRDELQRNPAILERMAEELDSALIMLNNRSINQRVRSQTEKQELSDILSR